MNLFPSRVLDGEDSQVQQAMGFTKSEEAHVCSLMQADSPREQKDLGAGICTLSPHPRKTGLF